MPDMKPEKGKVEKANGAKNEKARTKVKSGTVRRYGPPPGPSLARFTERMSHASKWIFGVLVAIIGISSVVFFAGGPFGGMGGPSGGGSTVTDETIFTVDGKDVPRSELQNAVSGMKQQRQMFGGGAIGIADEAGIYGNAVKELIQEKVELAAAQRSGVKVSETDFNKRMDELVDQQFKQQESSFESPKVFDEYLKNNGKTRESQREEIRGEMYDRAQERGIDLHEILNNELVVKNFKTRQEQALSFPRMIHYSQIVINFTSKSETAIKAKAEALAKKLQGGADFAKTAAKESNDTYSKSKGGDAGWAAVTGPGVPPYLKGADKAKVGQMLGPIKAYQAFYIIKITGEATHLPAKVDPAVDFGLQSAADKAYQDYLDGLVKKAKIEYKDLALAGAMAHNNNDDKTALADYQKALGDKKSLPSDEKGWVAYAVGQMLVTQNKAKDALPYFQQAVDAEPTSSDAWMAAGDAANKLGNKKMALDDYKKALHWGGGNLMALFQLQQQFKTLGDQPDAKAAGKKFQEAAAAQKNSPGGMFGGGMFGGGRGMPGGAMPGGMMPGGALPGGMMPGGPMPTPMPMTPGPSPAGSPIKVSMPPRGVKVGSPIKVTVPPGPKGGSPVNITLPSTPGSSTVVGTTTPAANTPTAGHNVSTPVHVETPVNSSLPGSKTGPHVVNSPGNSLATTPGGKTP